MENKREKQISEHYEVAKILAENFTPEEYDESDFKWCAFQLVQAGYRKQSDVAKEIFEDFENILKAHKIPLNDCAAAAIDSVKQKYTGEKVESENPENENRQVQVQEMAEVVQKVQYLGGLELTVAARLYDAGYRKQCDLKT